MKQKSILKIQIFDHRNKFVDKPTIRLIPAESKDKRSVTKFSFDDQTLIWTSGPVEFGIYKLIVVAKGCSEARIRIHLEGEKRYLTVRMSKEGLPFIMQGGKRFYYEEEKKKIGFILRRSLDRQKLEAFKSDYKKKKRSKVKISRHLERIARRKLDSTDRAQSNMISIDISRVRSTRTLKQLDKDLIEAPEVITSGQLIKSGESKQSILTSNFEIFTDGTHTWDSLNDLIKPLGLEVYYQSRRIPSLFHGRLKSSSKVDKGEIAEKLSNSFGVVQVNSIVIHEEETTAINTGDVVSPLQFYQFLTRLPEAWEEVGNGSTAIAESFGSADVIIAVHDEGIWTSGNNFTVQHDEFKENVTGGDIGSLPWINQRKVLYTFDFSDSPMKKGNNESEGSHGCWVSGTILANRDGKKGVVGGAANSRLVSFKWDTNSNKEKWADCFEHMAGIDPQWQNGIPYNIHEVFPDQINTGKNPIPYHCIINCSHTCNFDLEGEMTDALQRASLFGRNHRGVLIFVAAGNEDEDSRGSAKWGENYNVIKVAASSVNLLGEEVRANYSNYAVILDKIIDFAAPSCSQNFMLNVHEPPHIYGFTTTHSTNISGAVLMENGNVNKTTPPNITNSPPAGSTDIEVSLTDYAGFSTGDQVIITNTDDRYYSEWHTITKEAPNILRTDRPLGFSYESGKATITRLTGNKGLLNAFGGTSAAAPQASAIAALILSVKPQLSWLEVRQIMRETAVPINLRYRGTNYGVNDGNTNRYKWLDSENKSLIDGNGLLDIHKGENKIIPKAELTKLDKGTKKLTLNDITGLSPRQALVIGAETRLNSNHPRTNAKEIDVARANEFEPNDIIYVGRNTHSVIIKAASAGDKKIWIQSLDGFLPNDLVTIETAANLETVKIIAPKRMTKPKKDIIGPSDTGFKIKRLNRGGTAIAGGLRNSFPPKTIVRIARSVTTTMSPASTGDDTITVAATNGFVVGHDITIQSGTTSQTVRITAINIAASQFTITRLKENGAPIAGGLSSDFAGTITVRTAHAQFEGPFTVQNKVGNVITLDKPILVSGHNSRRVFKKGTELRAIIRVKSNNQIEIDPLKNDHAFNINGVEHIRVGRIADYSLGFGYGRLDAYEVVKAAKAYDHKDRDLMIRNFWESDTDFDDGETNTDAKEVESPDIWIRNGSEIAEADLPAYKDNAPHQHPQIAVNPPIFIGTGNNDMEVAGTKETEGEAIFTIEIDAVPGNGNPDTFKWKKDNGNYTDGVTIKAEKEIKLSDGVKVKFPVPTGHTLGDKWIVHTRKLEKRYVYIRTFNRGTKSFFQKSAFGEYQLDVAKSRVLLCLTDGTPVCRFSSIAKKSGKNDMEVTGFYNPIDPTNEKALYTVEISSSDAGGDKFKWWRDGDEKAEISLTAANLEHVLDDEVNVRFGSHKKHRVGDRWDIYARSGVENDPFLNLDHFWEKNEVVPHNLSSEQAGTRIMEPAFPVNGLASKTEQINDVEWLEADRFPTNSPNKAKPTRKLRMFALGEVIPHDGKLDGFTARQNNNFSYRELVFARFGFTKNNGADQLDNYLEVDGLGAETSQSFKIHIRTTAGFFEAEKTSVKVTAKKADGTEITTTFYYDTSTDTWKFDGANPSAWLTLNQPIEARRPDGTQPDATGEQYDIEFSGSLTVDNSYSIIMLEARIGSSFRDLVIAKEVHSIPIYEKSLLPSQRFSGGTKADLTPKSHFFTDHEKIVQTEVEAFGPVSSDPANRFRTTSLFKRSGASEPKAYSVIDGFVIIQRDPANNNVINLVLKPFQQPMPGFTPIKYFIYRGITLTDYLKGTSDDDEKEIREQAESTSFVSSLWALHIDQNGAVKFESKALGYDPDTQSGTDLLDDLFFRQDPNIQFPKVSKGEHIGNFFTNAGADTFGFEIILEEGEFQPDLDYVRKSSHEVSVAGMQNATDAEKFALRLKREEILNFMDPAAFYGLHRSDKGVITVDDGAGVKDPLSPDEMYDKVIKKFHTRNTLYIDIRNENGQSYNFYGKYDDGSGNALGIGLANTALTDQAYDSDSWPLIIQTRVSAANADAFDQVFIRMRKDYNKKPILYIEHGSPTTPVTKGRFIAGNELGAGASLTDPIRFRFPNHDLGAGNRIGSAWLLKLHYGLQLDPTNVPFPNEVPPTQTYLDNLFGPLSLKLNWTGAFKFSWQTAPDKKFMDASSHGFSHIVNRGLAIEEGAPGTGRILFYAAAKDVFNNNNTAFIPYKGLTGGFSKRDSFFEEALLFEGYLLEYDLIEDGGNEIKSLSLTPATINPRPPEAMMVLGLTKTEYNDLKDLGGFNAGYPRNVQLEELSGSPFTVNDKTYHKYKVGVRGLDDDGNHLTAFPATDMHVYSVDQFLFFSKAFSDLQDLPTSYTRNYEEAFGAVKRIPPKYMIKAVSGTNKIVIQGKDLRYEIVPGDKVVIKNSAANNGTYEVSDVIWTDDDSKIVVTSAIPNNTGRLGDLHEVEKPYEDFFIAKDIQPTLNGTQPMPSIVQQFISEVKAAEDNAAGLTDLTNAVNTFGLQIWNRARELCYYESFEYADDRILYWARIKMLVALKGHPQVLKSIKERNRLVRLLEDKSRGLDSLSIQTAGIKVLVSGFDPFHLGKNILNHNPSGAAALAMDRRTFIRTVNGSSVTFQVNSVVLPVRYRDFDRNGGDGIVEEVFEKHINPHAAGYKEVDMILALGIYYERSFSVDRFAARSRGGRIDNENRPSPPRNPSFKFPAAVAGEEFYETTLPANKLVPPTNPGPNGFDVFYNNAFSYIGKDDSGNAYLGLFCIPWNREGQYKVEDAAHPNNSKLIGKVPTSLNGTTTPKKKDIHSVSGSGGDQLCNEIFYRISRLRAKHNENLPAGFMHLPKIQSDEGDFVPSDNQSLIDALIQEIAQAVEE